ncbi:hypothetical protein [Clostridium sp. HBUAS56017]|uniref:hypothetical protein n=1 Tax=Clostridium sp. HBUAS56017 TaxID=2571128 RepID=UPI001177BF44|nr:hypothetical protein [Clostridium sp. HBUAS56017]
MDGAKFGDGNYEYDWGLCSWGYNVINGKYQTVNNDGNFEEYNANRPPDILSRYNHWEESIGYKDGWEKAHAQWANEGMTSNYLNFWSSYTGNYLNQDDFRFGLRYYGASKKDGGNEGNLWVIGGHRHQYRSEAVQFYKREKPIAAPGSQYINFTQSPRQRTYSDEYGDVIWATSGTVDFKANFIDKYPDEYGQAASNNGGIRTAAITVFGNRVNYAFDADRGQLTNFQGYGYMNTSSPYGGVSITNENEVLKQFTGISGDHKKNVDGIWREGTEAQMCVDTKDGYDYSMGSEAANKWGRWVTENPEGKSCITIANRGWMLGFGTSDDSEERFNTLKVDDQGPIWDGNPIIENHEAYDTNKVVLAPDKVIDGIKVKIPNLRDMRCENNTIAGVGLKENQGQYIIIYKTDSNGNSIGEGLQIYDYETYYEENSNNNNICFDVNFEKTSFKDYYGKLNVQFVSQDLLDNETRSKIMTVEKVDPTPEDGTLKVCKYDYNDGSNVYWVKSGSPFAVYTEGRLRGDVGLYPTETSLVMKEENVNDEKNNIVHKMDENSTSLIAEDHEDKEVDENYEYNGFIKSDYAPNSGGNIYEKLRDFPVDKAITNTMSLEEANNLFNKNTSKVSSEPKFNYLMGIHWLTTDPQDDNYETAKSDNNYAEAKKKYADENKKNADSKLLEEKTNYDNAQNDENSLYDKDSAEYALDVAKEEESDANTRFISAKDAWAESQEKFKEAKDLRKNSQDGRSFKLYSKTKYIYDRFIYDYNTEKSQVIYAKDKIKDSGIYIKFDGTAPTGETKINLDQSTLKMNINVKNVSDKCSGVKNSDNTYVDGSGVNKITARLFLVDDYNEESEKINGVEQEHVLNKNLDGTYSIDIDASKYYLHDAIKVKVFAYDNVGNIGQIKVEDFDLFTLKANLVPYRYREGNEKFIDKADEMKYATEGESGEIPFIKSGEEGRITINTSGGPTILEVNFPPKMNDCASLVGEKLEDIKEPIPAAITKRRDKDFKVPLYLPEKIYCLKITAYKGNEANGYKTKQAIVKFKLNNNVLEGVRTRLR